MESEASQSPTATSPSVLPRRTDTARWLDAASRPLVLRFVGPGVDVSVLRGDEAVFAALRQAPAFSRGKATIVLSIRRVAAAATRARIRPALRDRDIDGFRFDSLAARSQVARGQPTFLRPMALGKQNSAVATMPAARASPLPLSLRAD